ncbi:MAG: TonB-dependent receptor [Candidatus Solibacter usitatus]|nr:TonB-dependent receptor [Candidatus Solibacter usitatus]
MLLQKVCLLAFLTHIAFAQNGAIQGVVKDQSDAVIAAAQVTLLNLETGLRRDSISNDSGIYSFPSVPVGRYKVSATRQGFSTSEVGELKLDVGQVARVDFALKPGTLTESVTVTASGALIDSETSTVGQVIDNKRIVELPLNGRNYLELARLAAGAAPARGSRPQSEGVFAAAGQHGYQAQVNIDGVDNSLTYSGGPIGFEAQSVKPSVDAVGEFRVVTNNLSAEYGGRMGGHVFVNIKSGTNQLHGSAFEFLRNSSLDGTNFFANRSGSTKPPYKQNQFGGTLGGPVRKDKTFFFASYEGTRTRIGRSSLSTVPVSEARDGNFNRIRPVFDPATTVGTAASFTRTAFPGNIVPKNRWDPLFPKLLALYPLPTDTTKIVNNFFYAPSESNNVNTLDLKGDHNLSNSSRLSVRYSRRTKDRFEPGPLPVPGDGGLATTTFITSNSISASHNHSFTPTLANEFRFGLTDTPTRFDIPYDKPLFDEYGIKGIPKTNFASSNDHGLTRFSPGGYAEVGSRTFWPNTNNVKIYQFTETLFKTMGKHTIRAGGEYRRDHVFRNAARFARGQFAFAREFTANPANRAATGDGLAEFMLGGASGGTVGNENGEDLLANTFDAFLQDDWKITPRLTLNLGVRYDLFFAPTFPEARVSSFDLDFANLGANARLNQRRFAKGECQCDNDRNNFGPRIGLAYRLTNRTVLRAGAGVIYGRADSLSSQWARGVNQAPDFVEVGFGTLDRITPRLILKDGFPAVQLPATQVPGPAAVSIESPTRFVPTQYSQQWFFDVQRELPFDTLLTAGYSGNGTHQMMASLNYNLPYNIDPSPTPIANRRLWPFYTNVNRQQAIGNLNYNALLIRVEKRFSKGLTFLSAYTFSHTIDDVDEIGNNDGVGVLKPWDRATNRGSALTDLRHYYVLSTTYELPVGKGKQWMSNANRVSDLFFGGWQVSAIFSRSSGLPFTPVTSGGLTNAGGADRPNRLRDGALPAGERNIDRWFDVSAFAVQPNYTYGNSGRNILTGPPLTNFDFSLGKSFAITERIRAQFRAESFNATNTPAFGLPGVTINGPGVAQITSAGEPRRIQFGMKVLF